MCFHPWNLTVGTPSHEGLVDRYDFHVGLAFQGKFPGPPSQEEWTGRWSRNSSEWSAIPHVARDLQTRNAARMDYGSADGAFWNLARVRWVLVVSAPVVVVVFPYLFGKVLGMITMKDGVTHEVSLTVWGSFNHASADPLYPFMFSGAHLITLIFLLKIGVALDPT